MTHAIPMPEAPTRVTQCACGFTVLPCLSWQAWEQEAFEHINPGQNYADAQAPPGRAVETCKRHGLTEFRIKFRKGKRQRDCLACNRERDARNRAARREQTAV